MTETAEERRARLEALRSSAATSVKAGDIATTIDQDVVAEQLRAARTADPETRARRPVCATIRLS